MCFEINWRRIERSYRAVRYLKNLPTFITSAIASYTHDKREKLAIAVARVPFRSAFASFFIASSGERARRQVRKASIRQVFDRFAGFYGSIYGSGADFAPPDKTRMPGSLIGRIAMQKSGRYAVEYGAGRRYSCAPTTSPITFTERGYCDTSTTLISSFARAEGKGVEKVRNDIDVQQLPALFNPSHSRANRLFHKLCCPLYGRNARIEVFSLTRIFLILISRFI